MRAYYQRTAEYQREKAAQYRRDNRDKILESKKIWYQENKDKHRNSGLLTRYGITAAQYDEMMRWGCRMCGTKEDLHLDHDHKTGEIRGILCAGDNHALGIYEYLLDNPHVMERMQEYLMEHNAARR